MRIRKPFYAALMALCLLAGSLTAQQGTDTVAITIFHTTDEHGHLLPQVPLGSATTHGGAANVFSWLVQREGYDPEKHILLSGGDNWTGASISTWFEGIPTVQAFNMMGYDAVNGIAIVASGSRLRGYARVTVFYDKASDRVVDVDQEIVEARKARTPRGS